LDRSAWVADSAPVTPDASKETGEAAGEAISDAGEDTGVMITLWSWNSR
jgi:hypothetical protein